MKRILLRWCSMAWQWMVCDTKNHWVHKPWHHGSIAILISSATGDQMGCALIRLCSKSEKGVYVCAEGAVPNYLTFTIFGSFVFVDVPRSIAGARPVNFQFFFDWPFWSSSIGNKDLSYLGMLVVWIIFVKKQQEFVRGRKKPCTCSIGWKAVAKAA